MAWETIVLAGVIAYLGAAGLFFLIYREFTNEGLKAVLRPIFFMLTLFGILAAIEQVRFGWKNQAALDQVSFAEEFWITGLVYLIYFLIVATIIDLGWWVIKKIFNR